MAAYRLTPWIKNIQRKTPCSCVAYRSDRFFNQEVDTATVKNVIPKGQIKVPMKKKRDSLSILQALASTVEPIRGPAYCEVDDPYFLPDVYDRNILPLSKASGQRTARYFVNKYRNAFDHDDMAPFVQAFQPEPLDYKYTTPCNEAIQERIQKREVIKAAEVYLKMKQQGLDISEAVKLELLELLCYYNSVDPEDQKLPLEAYFEMQDSPNLTKPEVTSEEVFNELAEKTEDAYNWMLQNYCMYRDIPKAKEFYKKMKVEAVTCHRNTYHEILKIISQFKNEKEYINGLKRYVDAMVKEGHECEQDTLYCILLGLNDKRTYFSDLPKVLSEMKSIGIEPNYQAWSVISSSVEKCCGQGYVELDYIRNSAKMIIRGAIEHMKLHPEEIYVAEKCFFSNALFVCQKIDDVPLALKVHRFRESLGYKHIPRNEIVDRNYFSTLFKMLAYTESCETIMKIYNKTFGVISSTTAPFKYILSSLDTFKEYQHVPKLLDDFLQRSPYFPKEGRSEGLLDFLNIIDRDDHSEELKNTFLQQNLQLYKMLKKDLEARNFREPIDWLLVVKMIGIFLRSDLEMSWQCLTMAMKNSRKFNRINWHANLQLLLERIIEVRDKEKFKAFYEILFTKFHHTFDVEAYRDKLASMFTPQELQEMITQQKQRKTRTYSNRY